MPRVIRVPGEDARLEAFARKLNRLLLEKNWNQTDLAREATKFTPKGRTIGRHLISAYCRGASRPTDKNLTVIAQALGVSPEELLPVSARTEEIPTNFATATTGLNGGTRIVVDAEVPGDTALKILEILRAVETRAKKRGSA
jgi:transcriptional regulator with XRE-family HTH domain